MVEISALRLTETSLHKKCLLSIQASLSKCDQITGNCGFGRKSSMENFIFSAVLSENHAIIKSHIKPFK